MTTLKMNRTMLSRKKMMPMASRPANLKGTLLSARQVGTLLSTWTIPVCITLAIPPVAIVIVKKVHV